MSATAKEHAERAVNAKLMHKKEVTIFDGQSILLDLAVHMHTMGQ